jgi:CheY-like chemotaxis protein
MQKLAQVLLVDDDTTATFLHTHLLTRLQVADQLLVAHNGREALQRLDRSCAERVEPAGPILVLLDLNMPVMNGVEFLETYQQHPSAQQLPVVIVVLTSSEDCRDITRLKRLPMAVDVLTKPLTREKVETILHRHFRPALA